MRTSHRTVLFRPPYGKLTGVGIVTLFWGATVSRRVPRTVSVEVVVRFVHWHGHKEWFGHVSFPPPSSTPSSNYLLLLYTPTTTSIRLASNQFLAI